MGKSLTEKIEYFIKNWYWDEKSKIYAFEMGKFLFAFLNYAEAKFSERTYRKHWGNVSLIVGFEMNYGYNDIFEPANLAGGTKFLYEFKRKVSDTNYGIQSYNSTWKQLDKFIISEAYKLFLAEIEAQLKQEENI